MTESGKPLKPDLQRRSRHGAAPALTALARALLLATLVIVVAVLAMPGAGVSALADQWPELAASIRRLKWIWPGIDIFHALLFAVTGLLAALAYPSAGTGRLLLVLFVLAAFTEYLQVWIPGRSSSLLELAVDLAGAVAGVTIGRLATHVLARSARKFEAA